jgi:hypothetical protein
MLLAFNIFCFATDARIYGLGVEPWMVNDDDMLMSLYPSQVINNQNEIEFGAIGRTAYVDYTIDSYMLSAGIDNYTGETAMTKPQSPYIYGYTADSGNVENDNVWEYLIPTKSFYLTIARQLNDGADVALKFCGARAEDNGNNIQEGNPGSFYYSNGSRLSQDYNLALGLTIKDLLDISVTVGLPYVKNSGFINYTSDTLVTTPYMDELLKYDYGVYGKVNARVILSWLTIGASYTAISEKVSDVQREDLDNDGVYDMNDRFDSTFRDYEMAGGAAANLKLNDFISVIAGISVNYVFVDNLNDYNYLTILLDSTEVATDMFTVPVYFAVEDRINENITWRAGLKQVVFANDFGCSVDYLINPTNYIYFTNPVLLNTTFASGLSYNIGNITLDGVITLGYGLTSEISGKLKF